MRTTDVMSQRLWRALQTPPTGHPLYERIAGAAFDYRIPLWILLALGGLVMLAIPTAPIFICLMACVNLLAVLGFPIVVNLCCLTWASLIAGRIAEERQGQRYPLLAVTPGGALSIDFVLSLACLHQRNILRVAGRVMSGLSKFGVAALVLFGGYLIVTSPAPANAPPGAPHPANPVLEMVGMMALLYLDYGQIIVLSTLTGMSAGQALANKAQAWVGAGLLFLLIQASAYGLMVLIGYVALPALISSPGAAGWEQTAVLVAARAVVLLGAREVAIRLLWRHIARDSGDPFVRRGDVLLVSTP